MALVYLSCGENYVSMIRGGQQSGSSILGTLAKISVDKSNTINEFAKTIQRPAEENIYNKKTKASHNRRVAFLPMIRVRNFDKETRELIGDDKIRRL